MNSSIFFSPTFTSVCGGGQVCTHVCLWRPEADISDPPQSLPHWNVQIQLDILVSMDKNPRSCLQDDVPCSWSEQMCSTMLGCYSEARAVTSGPHRTSKHFINWAVSRSPFASLQLATELRRDFHPPLPSLPLKCWDSRHAPPRPVL